MLMTQSRQSIMHEKKCCPHRELAYCNLNAVMIHGQYTHICMHCLHAYVRGYTPMMISLSSFPAELSLDADPRLDTETRISAAELHYPIIIDTNGRIIDGKHRIVCARRRGLTQIAAVMVGVECLLACAY